MSIDRSAYAELNTATRFQIFQWISAVPGGADARAVYSGTSLLWTPLGPKKCVLITEVSLFQRLICAQRFTIGTSELS